MKSSMLHQNSLKMNGEVIDLNHFPSLGKNSREMNGAMSGMLLMTLLMMLIKIIMIVMTIIMIMHFPPGSSDSPQSKAPGEKKMETNKMETNKTETNTTETNTTENMETNGSNGIVELESPADLRPQRAEGEKEMSRTLEAMPVAKVKRG